MPRISSYKISIIYGLSDAKDAPSVARLADKRIPQTEIIPYDVLLARFIDQYSISRRDTDSLPGWCFVCHIVIAPEQINPKAYIFDVGAPGRDRVSMYLEGEDLVLECIDSSGQSHTSPCEFIPNKPLYVRFEISTDSAGLFISCNVNNEEVDLRVAQKPLEIAPDIRSFFLGSDITGLRGGRFKLLEKYFVNKTMGIEDKLGSFHYFRRKTEKSGRCLEFNGTSFMVRGSNGHLMQTEDDSRPIFRISPTYP